VNGSQALGAKQKSNKLQVGPQKTPSRPQEKSSQAPRTDKVTDKEDIKQTLSTPQAETKQEPGGWSQAKVK